MTYLKLSISELYTWLERIFNQVKRDLKQKILPNSKTYEESMETILYNLRAVAVNIDFSTLTPKSYQLEDYHMVFDKRAIDYKSDDGGNQGDIRFHPVNIAFINMELKHPYCIPGVYNMSCQEFTECNLNAQSNLHIGTNRFALTTTVNITAHE